METSVGSFEAKTHLPRLLKRVAKGERITITRRGVPVAVLVPPEPLKSRMSVEDALRAMARFHEGDSPLLGSDLTIRDLIEDGRRR